MAAIHAAAGGGAKRPGDASGVLVVESTRDGGRKILISGGGRCNVLPGQLDESRFVTDSSPNTMKKMLRSWPLAEQRRFFEEELGVPLRLERETGKLFPASDRARDVRDALVGAARARGAEFLFETTVVAIEPVAAPETERPGASPGDAPTQQRPADAAPGARPVTGRPARWRLRTRDGRELLAGCVVLATGGLSVPKTGSDGTGLAISRRLGHELHPTYAALTPLVCDPPRFRDLAGVSLDVALLAPGGGRAVRTRGGFLFTHRGYSGPAVLDLSHLAVRSSERPVDRALPREAATSARPGATLRQRILVQWSDLDREGWLAELQPRRAGALAAVRAHLPARLAEALLAEAGVPPGRSLAELRSDERRRLVLALTEFELPWTGHEGYRTAEVTGGGVALSEVDPGTMESRRCPGLFLCGEMLDAFGPIGGYNFLWAWTTGRAAGQSARQRASG